VFLLDLSEAGAPEVEITREMIEAGREVVWDYFSEYFLGTGVCPREIALEIFREMDKCRISKKSAAQ
jgi:hypothetical protein